MRLATGLALAAASVALGGCSAAEHPDPAPHADVTAADSAVTVVEEAEADLVLIVSNQSLDDRVVRLSVAVDGLTVVDGAFHVEDQHHWVRFPLRLAGGDHVLTARSDSGATLRTSFEVPPEEKRYAVLEHWAGDGSGDAADPPAHLTWQFRRQAPVFA